MALKSKSDFKSSPSRSMQRNWFYHTAAVLSEIIKWPSLAVLCLSLMLTLTIDTVFLSPLSVNIAK